MFHKDFYPTPASLASRLIAGMNFDSTDHILEPSAGKGDLLDVIQKRYPRANLYAIEINPDLRAILRDKGYAIVADDFLDYQPRLHFTHIVMNPPFSLAEDHLLYAWNMLYEGEIICIYPTSALEGKTTKEMTLNHLIADHGQVENIGPAFARAERPTDVEVSIVRLRKTASGQQFEWDVRNDRATPVFDDDTPSQEVALTGFVDNLLAAFNAAVQNYEDYNRARQRILVYSQPLSKQYGADPMKEADACGQPIDRYNTFVSTLQSNAWDRILDHPRFQSILTDRARKMMADFRARQKRVDFNAHNIRAMFGELVARKDEILMGAVLDAFDTMTKYYTDNRIYYEGWKSNKAWKVNRKVVLPYFVTTSFGLGFRLDYRHLEELNDIDRAMCVVSGRAFDTTFTMARALETAFRNRPRNPGRTESTFFDIRYFLKGTIHLKFLDESLWKRFNYLAAKGRSWLPPGE